MKTNTRKQRTELLIPGERAWERWLCDEKGTCTRDVAFAADAAAFSPAPVRRVLGIPASWALILPAWLHGATPEQLRSVASLYLERMGVRTRQEAESLQVARLEEQPGATLARIATHREHGASLSDYSRLPDASVLTPSVFSPPSNSIVIWRELGRLVMAVTRGNRVAYYSQLSAAELDEHAVTEILNVCVQLGFQQVTTAFTGIMLWTDEGNDAAICQFTGLPVQRRPRPAPHLASSFRTSIMPPDITAARLTEDSRRQKRLVGLTLAAVASLAIAAVACVTLWASHQRNALRDEIAALLPRASRVEAQKRQWDEAAPAVDPTLSPMEMLLQCMAAPSSKMVALSHFEMTPDLLVLRGRTETAAHALQFVQETRGSDAFASYDWEAAPPAIASDNSASFELKGIRRP